MDFERFADGLDYPMLVVTAVHGETGERSGCLVGFASQCSIEPARFLVAVSKANHTHRVAWASPVLAVHALGAHQQALAALFGERSGDNVDKFARCRWTPGEAGVPLLEECPRRFTGRVVERLPELGDHSGFLLEPRDSTDDEQEARPEEDRRDPGAGTSAVERLLMFSDVRTMEPGHPA